MNKSLLKPRHLATHFQLKEGTGPITGMCAFSEFIEIFTVDETFCVESPNSIDPSQTNPNAPWITKSTNNIGTKNPIVARVLLQGDKILKSAWFEKEINKKLIISSLHSCKESLLRCDKVSINIQAQINEIISKINNEGILTGNFNRTFDIPQVLDLPNECSTFLSAAKRAIKSICELPSKFYTISKPDNNFDTLATTLHNILGKDHQLVLFVSSNASHIKHIIDLRNYEEHPGKISTIINNFRLNSKMEIIVPEWNLIGEQPRAIGEEMIAIVNYLTEIGELMLIFLVMSSVRKEIPFLIEKIEEDKINPDLPIKYRLSIDNYKLQSLIKMNNKI